MNGNTAEFHRVLDESRHEPMVPRTVLDGYQEAESTGHLPAHEI